ncbi:MAG: peptide chain release factor N(5)-glutamine methyltransferase, partial [Planctomycetes bacterium]|nr:peptide chain release factor N(5)-glutamine methyltransferase [Planctomycetota bacterium]
AANAARHRVADRIEFAHGSWWDAVPSGTVFDLVVSNPPYIDPQRTEGLAADVRAHEPPLALFTAPGDVVSCYRAIGEGLATGLAPGGWFVAETGLGASAPALAWLLAQPFLQACELLPDLAGQDRFLLAQRRA